MKIRGHFKALSCVLVLFSNPVFASESNSFCHLHPPGAAITEENLTQLPKFDSSSACYKENLQRYSATGRCHCSFSLYPYKRLRSFNRNDREQEYGKGDSPLQ